MSIIRVDNLGKRYTIGHDRRAGGMFRYASLRDTLAHQARALWQRARHPLSPNRENTDLEEFWALRDLAFEIQPGERVGIIGRNGAGKSTLLKLLSRITEPTTGRIELNGRVASLLEVGTGFHPELTGRENIYLNGAILGMTRAEIKAKFDAIVDFAEVEKFLDTPVKRYSSGMYVRLAFAVAAHLEPEILLVDEVLAVGDASFQKKCLGKMEDVAIRGRTVIFVSHNMGAIAKLCKRVLWLSDGLLKADGEQAETTADYLTSDSGHSGQVRWDPSNAPGNERIRILAMRVTNDLGQVTNQVDRSERLWLEFDYEILETTTSMQVGFWLQTVDGTTVFVGGDRENAEWSERPRTPGKYRSRCAIPEGLLNAKTYTVSLGVDLPLGTTVVMKHGVVDFTVKQSAIPAHSSHGSWQPPGVICLSLDWDLRRLSE